MAMVEKRVDVPLPHTNTNSTPHTFINSTTTSFDTNTRQDAYLKHIPDQISLDVGEIHTIRVPVTMEHSGPLAPWKIEERAKQKEDLDSRKKLREQREPRTITVFSSKFILGYDVENY
ncbi:hypothetical protein EAE96_010628 [Botrytis aclada]|nr:hypothetical protein EAE96_010628 [Botrytis aclada]